MATLKSYIFGAIDVGIWGSLPMKNHVSELSAISTLQKKDANVV